MVISLLLMCRRLRQRAMNGLMTDAKVKAKCCLVVRSQDPKDKKEKKPRKPSGEAKSKGCRGGGTSTSSSKGKKDGSQGLAVSGSALG